LDWLLLLLLITMTPEVAVSFMKAQAADKHHKYHANKGVR
jgi:hypothetical protein